MFAAGQDLIKMGAENLREEYEYEDDEDPDADHEICGCTIVFDAPESNEFLTYGCYHY